MYFNCASLLLTLSVTLSSVQARVAYPAPVCREDNQLRALERYPQFASGFCPAFLAGKYPRWLDHWNKKEVSSACSCYQRKATSHGAHSSASITGTLSFSSTAPAALSSVFATTTPTASASPSASAILSSAAVPSATGSTSRYYTAASSSGGYYPTASASGGYYPSGSAPSSRFPSGTPSRGVFPSGSGFGTSGSLPTTTGTAANSSLPSVPNRGVSPLSSLLSASASVPASSSSTASAPVAEGASSVASSTTPSGTSSLPAGDNYPPQPPGAGPGKRGLVYTSETLDGWSTLFKKSKYATYGSNGGLERGTQLDESFHFVPTLVVDSDLNNAEWHTSVPVLIEGGTKALFASAKTEGSQSSLTAEQAATIHKKYLQPYTGTVQLGTPPITNGNGGTSLSYLEEFVTSCTSCSFNFVDLRFYLERTHVTPTKYAQALRDYIENDVSAVQAKHPQLKGLPIFISGWWLNGVSLAEGGELMEDLLPYLDNEPKVLAYQASAGVLEGGFINADATGLTPAGQRYNDWTADVANFLG